MSRVGRRFRFKDYKKTTVFLDPEAAAIMKALFPMKRYGVSLPTDYVNHAIKCLHAGKLTPLPGSVKESLPALYKSIRSHVPMSWKDSVALNSRGLRLVLPKEWYMEFEREAALEGIAVSSLIKRRISLYLTKEEIEAEARGKNVPYNYMYRELLMNVFPNIPIVDFGPAQRGNLARLDARINKYTIRRGDRRKEERRALTDTERMVATLTTESSEEAKAFYAILSKEQS